MLTASVSIQQISYSSKKHNEIAWMQDFPLWGKHQAVC